MERSVTLFDFKKAFDSVPYQRLLLKLKSYGHLLEWITAFLHFDSVPHQRLLLKLKSYGIEGLLEWITAFLTNRK